MSPAVGEAAAKVPRTPCADLSPPSGAWRRLRVCMFRWRLVTVGNEPAILVLQNVAMASRALPRSKMPRLKVTIVDKLTLVGSNVRVRFTFPFESSAMGVEWEMRRK